MPRHMPSSNFHLVSTHKSSADRSIAGQGTWGFRGDVEGLRAIAILLVVLYHAGVAVTRAGFLGVDVFFVLSGFLITGILVAEVGRTGTVSLSHFWARRARRLLAAAILVSLVTLAASL